MMTIKDPETYKQYTSLTPHASRLTPHASRLTPHASRLTPPVVQKHGGKFLTRGEEITCVEGQDYDGRMVILEFPSKADVEAWFADPGYQEEITFRHAASTMNYLLLQEGGANNNDPDPKL